MVKLDHLNKTDILAEIVQINATKLLRITNGKAYYVITIT